MNDNDLPLDRQSPEEEPRTRILVPIDGSRLSERILGVVSWFVVRCRAEITLLSVIEPEEGTKEGENVVETTCDYLDWRRQIIADGRALVHYAIRVGDPAQQILSFADEWHPDMIAMATHGRSGIARWRRGSVTETVLRRSSVPVLTANPAALDEVEKPHLLMMRNILVPLDGSERAARIVPLVSELSRRHGSSVTLLHVVDVQVASLGIPPFAGQVLTPDDAGEILAPARQRLIRDGVSVRARSVTGTPASSIAEIARAERSDVIALATHGRSGLARLVLGSVAEQVLRQAPCPVLIQRTVDVPVEAPSVK